MYTVMTHRGEEKKVDAERAEFDKQTNRVTFFGVDDEQVASFVAAEFSKDVE